MEGFRHQRNRRVDQRSRHDRQAGPTLTDVRLCRSPHHIATDEEARPRKQR